MTTSDPASELVALYGPQINKVLFDRFIPAHAWPDIKQELRIRLFRSIRSGVLHDLRQPFSFVYTAAIREAANWLRKERRHRRLELPERPPERDFTEDMDREQRHARLYAAINELPLLHRRIMLHVLNGGALAVIAEDTGYSYGNIKRKAFDARAMLRRKLGWL